LTGRDIQPMLCQLPDARRQREKDGMAEGGALGRPVRALNKPGTDISPEVACPLDRRARTREDADRRAHHDAIFALARASEMHDEDTGAHLLRIRLIVEQIAQRMGFDAGDAASLGYDAILHDVGKLRVPAEVLKKPEAFTDHERDVMRQHTIRGWRLLHGRASMDRAGSIARSHHERWDGTGYPDGLVGDAIPLEARITAAADVLDALIAARCYKQSWSYEDALREVIALSGAHLDPRVVAAIQRADAEGALRPIFELSSGER
jgi:putative two-component system response regulator